MEKYEKFPVITQLPAKSLWTRAFSTHISTWCFKSQIFASFKESCRATKCLMPIICFSNSFTSEVCILNHFFVPVISVKVYLRNFCSRDFCIQKRTALRLQWVSNLMLSSSVLLLPIKWIKNLSDATFLHCRITC